MLSGGLPHDAMHDILEGIAPCEIKLVLSHCIASHPFTLDEFNDRLLNFNYGYSECDNISKFLFLAVHCTLISLYDHQHHKCYFSLAISYR